MGSEGRGNVTNKREGRDDNKPECNVSKGGKFRVTVSTWTDLVQNTSPMSLSCDRTLATSCGLIGSYWAFPLPLSFARRLLFPRAFQYTCKRSTHMHLHREWWQGCLRALCVHQSLAQLCIARAHSNRTINHTSFRIYASLFP